MLYLRFRSGELYRYLDLPPQTFSDFLTAESKGQYFSRNIRERFRCEHLVGGFGEVKGGRSAPDLETV